MKELEFLHYRPGSSIWHQHDPRLKLLELALWSILALGAAPLVMAGISVLLLVLHVTSGSKFSRMKKPLLFWGIMAVVIILAAGLSDQSKPFSSAGLITGALRAARLLTVLLAGQLLAATTDPADLAGAVRKITCFLPSSWSGSLATAISLTLAFIPRILDQGATIRDAAFSRGLGSRKSVFRRAISLGLPMAEGTIQQADRTSEALISRCYVDNPTAPDIRITFLDLILTIVVILPPLGIALLTRTL